MLNAAALAELIGKQVTLKKRGPTTWVGWCPNCTRRSEKPHFWVFDFDGHGMFKCHGDCQWSGNEATWRQFTKDSTPIVIDHRAIKNDARERAEALFRVRARPDAAMPEEDIFTPPPTKLDALRQQMADRLGWKS